MISLTAFNTRFTSRWRIGILALLAILLFTRLGFWQLQRAYEKKQMLAAHHAFAKRPPMPWKPDVKMPAQYEQVMVEGHFLPDVLLLDNQHYKHQFGYHVISPFMLTNGSIVLIDRGWLKGDMSRQTFPDVPVPKGTIRLMGSAYYPSSKNWALGPIIEKKRQDVTIIELIDVKVISQFLHKSVYPFIIRQSKQNAHGFIREWPIVAMPPQRHYAYALQWFAMALVILILFLTVKQKHEN